MNVLVLGGSRFVGLHLVYELLDQGHNVAVLNRGVTQADLPGRVERLVADRSDARAVAAALEGRSFDGVCDISGYTPQEVNAVVQALKTRIGHYIFCGTSRVYDTPNLLPTDETSPLFQAPRGTQYAWDKIACEELLAKASEQHGFAFTSIRLTNTYGPHSTNVRREFGFFARLERGRPIILPANGVPLASSGLGYVGDVAKVFSKVLGNPAAYGETFNATGAEITTLGGWVRLLGEIVGVEPRVVSPPPALESYVEWSASQPQPPNVFPFEWRRPQIHSVEKAKRILGYAPITLRRGWEITYEWYKKQPDERWQWDFSHDDECLRKMGIA